MKCNEQGSIYWPGQAVRQTGTIYLNKFHSLGLLHRQIILVNFNTQSYHVEHCLLKKMGRKVCPWRKGIGAGPTKIARYGDFVYRADGILLLGSTQFEFKSHLCFSENFDQRLSHPLMYCINVMVAKCHLSQVDVFFLHFLTNIS